VQPLGIAPTRSPLALQTTSAEQLLALVAQQQEDAFAALYDRFRETAFAVALRVLRDREFAEDAVQEAFAAVWRTAAAFRPELGSAHAWLLTLVHRRAVDRVRREQRHSGRVTEMTASHEPTQEHDAATEQLHVRVALMRLSSAEREVITLTYYESLTQEETAVALGIPVGTVKSRTARALARLAAIYHDGSERVVEAGGHRAAN
jgi:RNA polymerase sigma-70 factor, ECF subfamily